MPKRIADFQVTQLGVTTHDSFAGFGVAFTPFAYATYGIGHNALEALDDAIEQIAQCGFDVEPLEGVAAFDGITADTDALTEREIDSDLWVHVGIRYNVED